ncbi:MAG TPA: DNA gyrase inhibitor YacG [Thermodesulfobacteriota bacterium]|nr:DNA gyrase inhibitor YacG [Thermodesulfobacteriota bacterium]
MRVKCPRCGTVVEWQGNEWRPFCSERCKLIDLGAWASEEYRIPEESSMKENIETVKKND